MNKPITKKKITFYHLREVILNMVVALAVLTACSPTGWVIAIGHEKSGNSNAVPHLPTTVPVDLSNTNLIDENELEQSWGIEIWQVNVTGVGGLINFRLRILDDSKASYLIGDTKKLPVLISERNGMSSQIVASEDTKITPSDGEIHIYFYGNPDGNFRPGDSITIVIGSLRVEHYIIQ